MATHGTKHWREWAGIIGGGLVAGSLTISLLLGDTSTSPLGALLDGLLAVALVLVVLALWGTWERVGGVPATFGLSLAALGGASAVVGLAGLAADTLRQTESGPWWASFVLGLLGLFLGASVLMLVGLAAGTLPRLGAGLVLAGAVGAIVSGVVSSIGYAQFSTQAQQLVGGALVVAVLLFAVGWVVLGVALSTERVSHPRPGPA
jgi:hypothetical protein